MCGWLTKFIKYSSIFMLVVSIVSALPVGWPRVVGWASGLVFVLLWKTDFAKRVKDLTASATATVTNKKARRVPRRIRIEGPPSVGKTTWMNLKPLSMWQETFGRTVRFVPEDINQDALRLYNDPSRSNEYSFLFELYTRATRERDEESCRADASCTYVYDRTLIGCHVFRVVNYTLGFLQQEHALQLFAERLLQKACEPISLPRCDTMTNDDGLYDDVIVYCPTSYSVCRQWLIKRDGADVKMSERYHKLTVFTYAYVMLQIAEKYPHIGLLTNDHVPAGVPTAEDYEKGRQQTILGAELNIDVGLSSQEMERFMEGVDHHTPKAVVWFDTDNGGSRCCSKTALLAAQQSTTTVDSDDKRAATSSRYRGDKKETASVTKRANAHKLNE